MVKRKEKWGKVEIYLINQKYTPNTMGIHCIPNNNKKVYIVYLFEV